MRGGSMLTIEEIEALLKLGGAKLNVHEGYVFGAYIRGTDIFPTFPTIRGTGVTAQEAANSAWRKYADNRRD